MYLTQFSVNVGRRAAREMLVSPERTHAAVLGCFPPGQHRTDEARTLWRLDRRSSHDIVLLISSPLRPDLTALNEECGWSTGTSGKTADYAGFLAALEIGQRWAFRLAANPVHAVADPARPGARGRRVAHVTASQQLAWLLHRSERHGFSLGEAAEPTVAVTRREMLSFKRKGKTVTVSRAQFDGVLEVTDADSLKTAIHQGIGPAKGYGLGMLTLARPHKV